MSRNLVGAILLSATGLAYSASVHAADMAEPPIVEPVVDSGWTFAAAPYLWMAGINGQIGIGGRTADVDISFSEIFDALDWSPPPVMIAGEARNGRYALFTDFIYLGTEEGGTLSGPLAANVNVDMTNIIWTFGGSYRVLDNGTATLDVLAGGRLWYMDADITLTAAPFTLQASGSKTWVDPIIGVSGSVDLGNGFGLHGEADIGGFGAAADLDWQVIGALKYQVKESIALELGYRYLDVNYDRDGFVFDVAMQGPIVGASFRF
jgi:hypothetical protein